MREVNFSIPNANKASVGITTALYDRRALDCTSTLPLINSLSHLAYLTTSSARIRDILTVDGGVERLVCILKEGRNKDVMDMWKWNLAFQCVVNIGVRGSESVRTRVVEADMVPVIATILDNYVRVIDKCREKAEAEMKRNPTRLGISSRHSSRNSEHIASLPAHRSQRSRPPPIEIPQPFGEFDQPPNGLQPNDPTRNIPAFSLSSPPERTTFRPHHHHHHRSHEGRTPLFAAPLNRVPGQPPVTAGHLMDAPQDTFGIRPVRDVDRLPSMLPALQAEITSQPESPTTPSGPAQLRPSSPRAPTSTARPRRRPSIRHQVSMSGDSDEGPADELLAEEPETAPSAEEPIVGLQNDITMQEMVDSEEMLDGGANTVRLTPPASEAAEAETFNITHRSVIDGSIINPATPQARAPMAMSPIQPNFNVIHATPAPTPFNWYQRLAPERPATPGAFASMPRDEDVLMSLQLLAYVSKYCNLRSYFQKSHLVPKLKVGTDFSFLPGGEATDGSPTAAQLEEDWDEEYLLPDDFNIFPLVEKFTVRHHSQDMQYWAGVVMRNLCRKDDSRGGIRQCAYYQCGKWEEYPRQFAKCRRCRRTKYCSKECQKSAWVYHRHWCVAAAQT
ncbi:MYND-type zinc finger protein samB [Aulographum hederae CBS 113979]|uniref:MYND-type zinc finger protein samB n=1 Tax=Aulographum hederae CBS 113979 TaxID=1176131 RepID=A0A6G1H9Z7_9PEZI|nr:MYND-type zinc finger protein samB [Aulographum hederae CBS 113979]